MKKQSSKPIPPSLPSRREKLSMRISAAWALALAVLTTGLLATPGAQASGARGGGHVVDTAGGPELLDLATRAVCDYRTGAQVLSENPQVLRALEKIAALDWYFAFEIKREIQYLTWCFTG